MMNQAAWERERWALIFAHPGHELRCHHVIERTRPIVHVLTDGSGAQAVPRIDESSRLLASLSATRGVVFGAFSDRDAYARLMAGDASTFITHTQALSDALIAARVTAVVIDAAEGYNPVHDVCHWMGRAAATRAAEALGALTTYELDLVSHPDGQGDGIRVTLDDEAFARKLRSADCYRPLAAEAAGAITEHGLEAFRTEFLRRVPDAALATSLPPASSVPYYEQVGEERVRMGRYPTVLRYGAHVHPVLCAVTAAPDQVPGNGRDDNRRVMVDNR